ncbi:MAG: sulfatase [Verrucomicrobia bacterium]|nr:sulfatase [Verrucomicrobiota bacterium]
MQSVTNRQPPSVSITVISRLILLLVSCVLGISNANAAKEATPARKPNVLFIAVDDLNHWVGYTGRNPQTKTPNIDRLSRMGVSFMRADCASPSCNPSRAALMSGMRPSTTGIYQNGENWKQKIPEGHGLSSTFQKAGYFAAGAGKIYHGNSYYPSEWDDYFVKKGADAGDHGPKRVKKMDGFHDPMNHDLKDNDLADWYTTDYCIEQLQQKHDKPLFLACGLQKPHLPWVVPRKYYDLFPLDEIQLPPYQEDDLQDIPEAGIRMAKEEGDHKKILKSGRWKAAIQSYLATIAYTDMNIGRLLDALEKSPHRDNTIIVLWGDHGWHLGEKDHWRKFALWEEAVRTPFIVVAPGVTKPGTISQRPVDLMSIYPTLCELTGIPLPKHVEGLSIKPLLINPKARWKTPALCTFGYNNHTVRTEQWRYIRYADGSEELYDHTKDPYEWTNLANDKKTQSVRADLARWFPKTNVPEGKK